MLRLVKIVGFCSVTITGHGARGVEERPFMRKGQAIPNIPPGYDSVHEVAEREGQSVQVLKRRCRRGEIEEARKIPGRGGGLWIVPVGARIPDLGGGRVLTEHARREIAARAHADENRTALAREYRVSRSYVYRLMDRYSPEG